MSKNGIPLVGKLEDSKLWKEGCAIAEYMYGILHELPEDEKWETERKLRTSANDSMYYISQAVANASPTAVEYDWSNARKSIASLKTMYRFAGRQKMINFDPEIMVRLDTLLNAVDAETQKAYQATADYNNAELKRSQQRYELWRNTEHEAEK